MSLKEVMIGKGLPAHVHSNRWDTEYFVYTNSYTIHSCIVIINGHTIVHTYVLMTSAAKVERYRG